MKDLVKCSFILVLIGSVSSCKKFLDQKSSNTISTPNTVFAVQALLDHKFVNENSATLPEISADNYFILPERFTVISSPPFSLLNAHRYLWQLDEYLESDWEDSYMIVYYSNLALESLEKIAKTPGNAIDWDNVKGSALFIRAYNFLNLVWVYGKAYDGTTSASDLGIALRLWSDYNRATVRSSVKESYEQVVQDAKSSIRYLPDVPLHCTRPSKGAAYGLLARTYLSMRMYDSAHKYADLALQINSQLINYNNYNNDPDIVASYTSSASPFRRFNRETIFYTEMAGHGGLVNSFTNTKIDTVLYARYDTNDWRRKAFFYPTGKYQAFKGAYSNIDNNVSFSGITTAEMYLVRAECRARKGNIPPALLDLNTLLVNRYSNSFVPVTAPNADSALNKILLERRKELIMRGLRWIDIKRLNKENANIILRRFANNQIYELPPNDDRYALPIPKQVLDLTGIPQNPGW